MGCNWDCSDAIGVESENFQLQVGLQLTSATELFPVVSGVTTKFFRLQVGYS